MVTTPYTHETILQLNYSRIYEDLFHHVIDLVIDVQSDGFVVEDEEFNLLIIVISSKNQKSIRRRGQYTAKS